MAQTKYCLINKKLYKCSETTNLPQEVTRIGLTNLEQPYLLKLNETLCVANAASGSIYRLVGSELIEI